MALLSLRMPILALLLLAGLFLTTAAPVAAYATPPTPPAWQPNVIFNGSVTLTPGLFTVKTVDTFHKYRVSRLTVLGALDAASRQGRFPYNVADSYWLGVGSEITFSQLYINSIDGLANFFEANGNDHNYNTWLFMINNDHISNLPTEFTLKNGDFISIFYYNESILTPLSSNAERIPYENSVAFVNITVTIPSGTFRLTTVPGDVDIFMDGVFVANTGTSNPAVFTANVGKHTLKFVKEGYRTRIKKVSLRAGRTKSLSVKLRAA